MIMAQQYGLYMGPDAELFDFFYISSSAIKQREDKINAAKEGKVYVS